MIGLWVVLLMNLAARPQTQQSPSPREPVSVPECPSGERERAIRGIAYRFTAGDFVREPGYPQWIHFLTEPVIQHVDPAGPSTDKLRPGEVIVAVDGYLITTMEGSRRFWFSIAAPVEVEVRRNGVSRGVHLDPVSECVPVVAEEPRASGLP